MFEIGDLVEAWELFPWDDPDNWRQTFVMSEQMGDPIPQRKVGIITKVIDQGYKKEGKKFYRYYIKFPDGSEDAYTSDYDLKLVAKG